MKAKKIFAGYTDPRYLVSQAQSILALIESRSETHHDWTSNYHDIHSALSSVKLLLELSEAAMMHEE